jgi:ABC-type proline/glycine betaine transport system substrate-binding protein
MKRLALFGIAIVMFALPLLAQPKFGVTVTAQDKATDFTKLKTYTWQSGWDAPAKVHEAIVAAADRELKALGLQKQATGGDVIIKYAALRRTDVQVSTKVTDPNTARGTTEVGSLVVLMTNSAAKDLWKVRLDQPLDTDPAKMTETIDAAVKSVFALYPTRTKK